MNRILAVVAAVFLPALSLPGVAEAQATLPWPSVSMGQIYLPFGLQWFQEGSRDRVAGYGEPECSPEACRWMVHRPDGTVIFAQSYHEGSLVGFRMDYILTREAGVPFRERVRELRESIGEDWIVTSVQDPLLGIVIPDESYRGESKDTRIQVSYREGEHSVTLSLDIRAK